VANCALLITLVTHLLPGFAVFGQLPNSWTLIGAITVVPFACYLLHRERITAPIAAVAMTAKAASQH
jgi:hypothetical protein